VRDDLERAAGHWAQGRDDVHALVLVGSRARVEVPADAWSDHDFVLVVDDVDPWLDEAGWLAELGRPVLSFVEEAAAGGLRERRVLFAEGTDADFTLVALPQLETVLARPDVAAVLARGFRVLVDKGVLPPLPAPGAPVAPEYPALVEEFWYQAILAARKLRRGELHVAAQSCNCGLRSLLRRALELEARAAGRDPWHGGRFLERWADPARRAALSQATARDDPADVARAITAACGLFDEVCEELGLQPAVDLPAVRRQLDALLGAGS